MTARLAIGYPCIHTHGFRLAISPCWGGYYSLQSKIRALVGPLQDPSYTHLNQIIDKRVLHHTIFQEQVSILNQYILKSNSSLTAITCCSCFMVITAFVL